MIFVTDKGQLCNNILQYGHLYAWGRENGRATMSMRFAHKYPEFRISNLPYHNFFVYLVAKTAARMGLIPTVEFGNLQSEYTQQEQVMLSHRYVLAMGWCVRYYDLFEKYKNEIIALFAFSERVEKTVAMRLGTNTDVVRLGIHVRRGDYARWCGGHYYYSDNQYVSVAKQFCQLFPDKKIEIYVCGNDPRMDVEQYERELAPARVHFPNGSPAEDLCLFSHCHYLIGPPSTFSLVATMYHDTRLYWMVNTDVRLELSDFATFNVLFRKFDDLYIPS